MVSNIYATDTILGPTEERDLELYFSYNGAPGLFSKLDHTLTRRGKEALKVLLRNPVVDTTLLTARQHTIKHILSNNKLLNSLDQALKIFQNNEQYLDAFWQKNNNLDDPIIKSFYFNNKYFKNLNQNPYALDAAQIVNITALAAPYVEHVLFSLLLSEATRKKLGVHSCAHDHGGGDCDHDHEHHEHGAHGHLHDCEEPDHSEHSHSHGAGNGQNFLSRAYTGAVNGFCRVYSSIGFKLHILFHLWGAKALAQDISSKAELIKNLQAQLIGVHNCVQSLKIIYNIIDDNDNLKEKLPEYRALEILFHEAPAGSPELKKLLKLLSSSTLSGQPSKLSHVGVTLAAYNLMHQVRDEFKPALKALGTIEAYGSIAKLFNAHQQKRVTYSFVEFEILNTPSVEIKGFWNPFLSTDIASYNDISFGTESSPLKAIISGPNAGGKSTTLRAVTLCVLLAQTFGIAPAASIKLTPFSKIITSFAVTDNIAAGDSLFTAEMIRACNIMTELKLLPKDKFSFVAIDELFRGTIPEKGQEVAYTLVKQLGDHKNNVSIVASHFPKLSLLATNNKDTFKNYKLEVTSAGGISSYLLKEGVSNQNTIFDIIQGANTHVDCAADLILP